VKEVTSLSDSILQSTKKNIGLAESYTEFDPDVIMHINTVFSFLTQLGIGPADGYMIEGAEDTWDEFLGDDPNLNAVKTYVYLRVRHLFDPPGTSYHLNAALEQIRELEWRLNTYREGKSWTEPVALP
jgi:hypothetical protein